MTKAWALQHRIEEWYVARISRAKKPRRMDAGTKDVLLVAGIIFMLFGFAQLFPHQWQMTFGLTYLASDDLYITMRLMMILLGLLLFVRGIGLGEKDAEGGPTREAERVHSDGRATAETEDEDNL